MSETTKIQWTHHTFNPWIGCTKVSEGCKHCYAEALAKRAPALVLGANYDLAGLGSTAPRLPVWGDLAPRRVTSIDYWKQPLRWDRAAAKAGKRRRVFCASMADVFEDVTGSPVNDPNTMAEWRSRLFGLIEQTPNLDWLLLTKRPENVLRMVESARGWLGAYGWPRNVWVGCTVENQAMANERLPHLLRIPAAVRFVSYEPALEAVDFGRWLPLTERGHGITATAAGGTRGIDWLIVGGESGHGARPFDLAWARSVVAQCKAAGVPVFVKQLGAVPVPQHPPTGPADLHGRRGRMWTSGLAQRLVLALNDPKGGDMAEWPGDLRVRQWPEVRP